MAKGQHRRAKRAVRKAVAKKHKRQAKQNKDTFFLLAKTEGVLTPVQGVTVANYLYFAPQLVDPGSGSWSVFNNAEFNLYRYLYDQVRINSIIVKLIPKVNQMNVTEYTSSTLNTTGDGVIHSVIDRDGQAPSNIARLTRYPSYVRKSLLKPITRSYTVRYPRDVWLDCQNITTLPDELTRMGLTGGPTFYAENLPEIKGTLINNPWYDVVVMYKCVFRGKTSASISISSSNVVVTPDPPAFTVPSFTFTSIRGTTSGDMHYDLSGNLVSISDSQLVP